MHYTRQISAPTSHLSSRGAIAAPLLLEVTRELTPGDLGRLSETPKTSVPTLQKLRATHHRQAQLLAQGRTPSEVAAIVGCTVQRLVQLQVDPAFSQLVHYYQDQVMQLALADAARLQDKIVDVGELAVDELRERLEDDEKRKRIHIGEIRKIAEFAMDRSVAPPKTAAPPSSAPSAITINFGTSLRDTRNEGVSNEPDRAPVGVTLEGEAMWPGERDEVPRNSSGTVPPESPRQGRRPWGAGTVSEGRVTQETREENIVVSEEKGQEDLL